MAAEDPRSWLERRLGIDPGPRLGVSFVARTTGAAAATLLLCRWIGLDNPVWAVVSSVVVILPEVRASVSNAAVRVVANLAGAGTGLGISLIGLPSLPSLAVGLPATALLCRLLGIDPAARTACVALVIVLLKDPLDVRMSSETRVRLVVLGCAVALFVTVVASQIEEAVARRRGAAGSG
jgi:uncharacterized membrane protein YgaE (UPF0421/DUF939 family)